MYSLPEYYPKNQNFIRIKSEDIKIYIRIYQNKIRICQNKIRTKSEY